MILEYNEKTCEFKNSLQCRRVQPLSGCWARDSGNSGSGKWFGPVGVRASREHEAEHDVMMRHEDKTSKCGIKHFSVDYNGSILTSIADGGTNKMELARV